MQASPNERLQSRLECAVAKSSRVRREAAASCGDAAAATVAAERSAWKIGALGSETRVATALSRARQGLYIIGNAEALAAESSLWAAVVRVLREGDAAGNFLSLLATRVETGKRALVRSGDDFDGVVGEYEKQRAAS